MKKMSKYKFITGNAPVLRAIAGSTFDSLKGISSFATALLQKNSYFNKDSVRNSNMKILSFNHNNNAYIYICGVDGAGKKSFASVFFADQPEYKELSLFKIHPKANKLLVIIVLDGVHSQNRAEEEVLHKVSDLCKKYHTLKISVLFVLNKVDLINERKKLRESINEVCTSYKEFLAQIACREIKFIAFSYRATKKFHDLLSREIDDEDCEDAKTMLAKVGKHFPQKYNPREMKNYLCSHKNLLRTLSGEALIARFIERWQEEQ